MVDKDEIRFILLILINFRYQILEILFVTFEKMFSLNCKSQLNICPKNLKKITYIKIILGRVCRNILLMKGKIKISFVLGVL